MTKVEPIVSYDCGCGFRVAVWKEAEEHARETGHQLTIHGRVVAEKDGNVKEAVPTRRRGDSD